MVIESRGACTSCGKEALLGDGLCVFCWDGSVREGEEALPTYPDPAMSDFVVQKVHERTLLLRQDTQELVQAVDELLTCLNMRQRRIVIARFGLSDEPIYTLARLGNEFDVTRERIRQVEAKALRRLHWQVYLGAHRKLRTYSESDELFTPRGMLLRAIVSTGRGKGKGG